MSLRRIMFIKKKPFFFVFGRNRNQIKTVYLHKYLTKRKQTLNEPPGVKYLP